MKKDIDCSSILNFYYTQQKIKIRKEKENKDNEIKNKDLIVQSLKKAETEIIKLKNQPIDLLSLLGYNNLYKENEIGYLNKTNLLLSKNEKLLLKEFKKLDDEREEIEALLKINNNKGKIRILRKYKILNNEGKINT